MHVHQRFIFILAIHLSTSHSLIVLFSALCQMQLTRHIIPQCKYTTLSGTDLHLGGVKQNKGNFLLMEICTVYDRMWTQDLLIMKHMPYHWTNAPHKMDVVWAQINNKIKTKRLHELPFLSPLLRAVTASLTTGVIAWSTDIQTRSVTARIYLSCRKTTIKYDQPIFLISSDIIKLQALLINTLFNIL